MGFKKLVNDTKIEKRRKIIAIYCRVSTDEQAEFGYSIDEQKRLLEEWCKANDYIIYK
ncbi:TPA: recombinase family protein, partial [Clostridium perfringens]|nr:recombinase family protein [Clostridium perfringens]HBI7135635.1 recombinase family protein [Clostridium perfringens]